MFRTIFQQVVCLEACLDNGFEHVYRQSSIRVDAEQSIWIGYIYIFSLATYIFIDYQLFGFTQEFIQLTTLRILMILYAITMIIILRQVKSYKFMDNLILIFGLGVVTLTLYIDTTRPNTWFYNVPVNLVLIVGLIVAVPNKLIFRLMPVGILSVGMVIHYSIARHDIHPVGFRSMMVAVIVGNVISWVASIRLNRYRRIQYKTQFENKQLLQEIEFLAMRDSLTKIYNHHQFMNFATVEFQRFSRYQSHFTLLLLDLDHFKLVNDNFGHRAGDITLQKFAQLISEQIRQNDICARIGGEEFSIILPETRLEDGITLANRIRKHCEEMLITTNGNDIQITTSIGVSEVEKTDNSFDDLFDRTDELLYEAKRNGRNQVRY